MTNCELNSDTVHYKEMNLRYKVLFQRNSSLSVESYKKHSNLDTMLLINVLWAIYIFAPKMLDKICKVGKQYLHVFFK